MFLKLLTVPDSHLREISRPVTILKPNSLQFLKDMSYTLMHKDDPPGVGLSAIQVGTPARIFMTYLPPVNDLLTLDENHPPQQLNIFINPEIIDRSETLTLGPDAKHPALEGCLSVPNLYGPIYRHQTIKIRYQTLPDVPDASNEDRRRTPLAGSEDLDLGLKALKTIDLESLTEKTEVFSNFYARVIQHEYDHLDGILFTDHTIDKSPVSSFQSLGKKGSLYFDNGTNLIEINHPDQLITW